MERLIPLLAVLFGLSACMPIVAVADQVGLGRVGLDGDDVKFFERHIRPLLVEHCYECHSAGAKTLHAGLRLDSAEGLSEGGDSGPVLLAGHPDESLLIQTIRYDGEIQMPPKGKLSPGDIANIVAWVKRGAPFPPSDESMLSVAGGIDFEEGRRFWSFQPLAKPALPPVNDRAWPQTRVDSFILAAMQREGLTPSPQADRATLIRRLSYDVIGLPPSPSQVLEFIADDSPDAYRRLIDRLLESPQYGEKWGRWWLDLARYTDRTASWLYQTEQSHLYRDWVVAALNQDMPYDQFVHRQLATDLMPDSDPGDLPALGFLSLSPTYWKELKLPSEIIKVIVADEWEERVDAVSRTFLGLTVACARCHDHKFDPVSSEDYYALAGIFASCRQVERPLISEHDYGPVRAAKAEVQRLEAAVEGLKKEKPTPQDKLTRLNAQIELIKETTPHYATPMANALSEESMYVVRAGETPQEGTKLEYKNHPRDLPLFVRGNPNRPGPIVPRRFLTVLAKDLKPYSIGSGRLELAESITTDAASLAARVLVNRVWLAHFGQGIVDTPSNFGNQGGRPSHPELLDDLAAGLIESGWSIKWLHRQILLSATWQQTSTTTRAIANRDPSNRWLSRMNQQRLTFEQWRDSMLVASDTLNRNLGGASFDLDSGEGSRRTLYATVHRSDMSPTLMVHDFPDPTQHSPMRTPTITPLQGLYAINGPLLLEQSKSLVTRLDRDCGSDLKTRIERVYWLLYSRLPSDDEMQLGSEFLRSSGSESSLAEAEDLVQSSMRWQQYVHVLLASNEALFID